MQPFVKVQKNKAYYKRFQVKWRRRRGELLFDAKPKFCASSGAATAHLQPAVSHKCMRYEAYMTHLR